MENQENKSKDLIQSKSANGALIALLAYLFAGGNSLDAETSGALMAAFNAIVEHLDQVGVIIGTIYAIYGRMVSESKITSVFGIKLGK